MSAARRIVGRISLDVWLVGGVALIFGCAWSLLTPLFQVPDEPAHYSYVQYLAETGNLPDGSMTRPIYSSEQEQLMGVLGAYALIGRSTHRAPQADASSTEALTNVDQLPRDNGGGSTTSTSQPPLYYGLAALVYRATSFLEPVAQFRAIRLFSVCVFAVGAMLAALLCGELFPRVPWARATGGLAVALAPVPGFIAAGVTPDNLLNTLVIGLTLAIVVGLRRPSWRLAAAIGLLAGLALTTKITFAGMVPAAAVAVAILSWRLMRASGARAGWTAMGAGAIAGLVPIVIVVAWSILQGRALVPPGTSTPPLPESAISPPSLREHLSYAWQLFLPRVPWQTDLFGFSPIQETWIGGWIGRYGWLDYGATGWVRELGVWCVWVFAALAVSGLVQHLTALRRSAAELVCFLMLAAGLGAAIALVGYEYKRTTGFVFEQTRYLFPLLGLYAAGIVAATIGLGRRVAPALAITIVGVLALHGASGLVLTVARYYAA